MRTRTGVSILCMHILDFDVPLLDMSEYVLDKMRGRDVFDAFKTLDAGSESKILDRVFGFRVVQC